MGIGGYDELGVNVFVPNCFGDAATMGLRWCWGYGHESVFPIVRLCRDQAWDDIVHAGEDITAEGVPVSLLDAWDFGKRSREYLNAAMEKTDLDHIYYEHAYEKEKGES